MGDPQRVELSRVAGAWVGGLSALVAVFCWYRFAGQFSSDLSTYCGPSCRVTTVDVGIGIGLWLGAAVMLTALSAVGLIVSWLAAAFGVRAVEERQASGTP